MLLRLPILHTRKSDYFIDLPRLQTKTVRLISRNASTICYAFYQAYNHVIFFLFERVYNLPGLKEIETVINGCVQNLKQIICSLYNWIHRLWRGLFDFKTILTGCLLALYSLFFSACTYCYRSKKASVCNHKNLVTRLTELFIFKAISWLACGWTKPLKLQEYRIWKPPTNALYSRLTHVVLLQYKRNRLFPTTQVVLQRKTIRIPSNSGNSSFAFYHETRSNCAT